MSEAGRHRGRQTLVRRLWESSKRFSLGTKHGRFSGISGIRLCDKSSIARPSYCSSPDVIFSHSIGRLALAIFSRSCSLVMGVVSFSERSSSVEVGDSVDSVRQRGGSSREVFNEGLGFRSAGDDTCVHVGGGGGL